MEVFSLPNLVQQILQLSLYYERLDIIVCNYLEHRSIFEILLSKDVLNIVKLHVFNDQLAEYLELVDQYEAFNVEHVVIVPDLPEKLDYEAECHDWVVGDEHMAGVEVFLQQEGLTHEVELPEND